MKQIFINKGKVLTEEVPVKSIEKGFVKIKTVYSCISMGTELAGITSSGKTLIQRAILDIYQKSNPKNEICCCAPTGRAARRMEQATGVVASTRCV